MTRPPYKELQRLLLAAEQRAQHAEQDAQQAKQDAQQAKQHAKQLEESIRNTTLHEYITACHNLIFVELKVESDRTLTTKRQMTKPQNKLLPALLEPWVDFLDEQRSTFGLLDSTFPQETQAFENIQFLQALGVRLAKRKVANEKDLEHFQHLAVEDPVKAIVDRLANEDSVSQEFGLGDGVVFENHPHALDDDSLEVWEHLIAQDMPPQTPAQARRNLYQPRADQICVYRQRDGASDKQLDAIA
jgi:hypothetical protein